MFRIPLREQILIRYVRKKIIFDIYGGAVGIIADCWLFDSSWDDWGNRFVYFLRIFTEIASFIGELSWIWILKLFRVAIYVRLGVLRLY